MNAQVVEFESAPRTALALSPEAERFALRQRQARMFAFSMLVPEHLRKGSEEQAMANCYIALTLAEAMGEVPLVVMQNIHVVNGKAGFATQYMIARANASGIFRGRIDWRIDKSDSANLKITAFATLKDTGQEVSVEVDMAMAIAEGWTKNPKYKSMPEVMLRYRSAAFLVRFYAPDVMLGYQSTEEIEDVGVARGPDLTAIPLSSAMLIEQAAPQTLAEELNDEIPAFDKETGEVAPQGMTEVSEETARELDANDGTLSDDNPTAAEGPADEQRGEDHVDQPAWLEAVRGIRGSIAAAKTTKAISNIEQDWLNRIRVSVDDEGQVRSVESDIAAKKRELAAGGEG